MKDNFNRVYNKFLPVKLSQVSPAKTVVEGAASVTFVASGSVFGDIRKILVTSRQGEHHVLLDILHLSWAYQF